MWKHLAAALLLAGLGSVDSAVAQQAAPPAAATSQPAASPAPASVPARWTPEDTAAFTDARIAALKAGLGLKPEQEKDWAGFEKAIRDLAKQQTERIARARSEPRPADPIALMRRRADAMTEAATVVRQLADAAEPLYRSLDDSQKRRMIALAVPARR